MSNCALRLPESLKQAAKRIAATDDTTMNQFFVVAIAEKVSAMETTQFFEKRAASASTPAAQTAWDKVGNKAAIAGDNWTKPTRMRTASPDAGRVRGRDVSDHRSPQHRASVRRASRPLAELTGWCCRGTFQGQPVSSSSGYSGTRRFL